MMDLFIQFSPDKEREPFFIDEGDGVEEKEYEKEEFLQHFHKVRDTGQNKFWCTKKDLDLATRIFGYTGVEFEVFKEPHLPKNVLKVCVELLPDGDFPDNVLLVERKMTPKEFQQELRDLFE